MKSKKIWLLGTVMALAVVLVSGCGKQGGDSATASPSAVEEQDGDGQQTDGSQVTEEVKNATVLKDAFQNDFTVGASILMATLRNEKEMEFVSENFNRVTMGNELKPENLLDREATEKSKDGMPEIRTKELDVILQTVKEKGLKLRGHCLVWHSQTPDWFFAKDYEPANGLVDKKTMRQRMETYIKKVLTYCQENYPGVIETWDVVNEGMGDDGGYRTESSWYQIYGDESYITDAFTFARKYADPEVKLFFNDYNEYTPMKRELIVVLLKELREKGLVDGMGMQSHWDMDYPSADMIADALEKYGEIDGLEIHLTEIDMHNTDNSEEGLEKQAERYREFFEAILEADRTGKANVTNVTFWGVLDEDSWLSGFRGETSYPLLFHGDFEKKPCFDSILETAKKEYK
ncbi:MAG: endo-1,4-beta-xylanase [Roseburia sp.]|nr:endo-1,4-beta-xylanase [Roseburia sp.]